MGQHKFKPEYKEIKTWEELDSMVSKDGKYFIECQKIGDIFCSAWIRPTFNTPSGEYLKHNTYLSTHTFYESQYKRSTQILRNFGFDVQLISWG